MAHPPADMALALAPHVPAHLHARRRRRLAQGRRAQARRLPDGPNLHPAASRGLPARRSRAQVPQPGEREQLSPESRIEQRGPAA